MTVTVVNLRVNSSPTFRCDRASPLGNPFILNNEIQRSSVLKLYQSYFHQNLNPDFAPPGFLEMLSDICIAADAGDITLGCWCAPRACHCDVIKEYVDIHLGNGGMPYSKQQEGFTDEY